MTRILGPAFAFAVLNGCYGDLRDYVPIVTMLDPNCQSAHWENVPLSERPEYAAPVADLKTWTWQLQSSLNDPPLPGATATFRIETRRIDRLVIDELGPDCPSQQQLRVVANGEVLTDHLSGLGASAVILEEGTDRMYTSFSVPGEALTVDSTIDAAALAYWLEEGWNEEGIKPFSFGSKGSIAVAGQSTWALSYIDQDATISASVDLGTSEFLLAGD